MNLIENEFKKHRYLIKKFIPRTILLNVYLGPSDKSILTGG